MTTRGLFTDNTSAEGGIRTRTWDAPKASASALGYLGMVGIRVASGEFAPSKSPHRWRLVMATGSALLISWRLLLQLVLASVIVVDLAPPLQLPKHGTNAVPNLFWGFVTIVTLVV